MKKHTIRRILFWMLLALFVALVAWWTLYVPYRPDRLYDAIPANATFVSVHQNLAGRWPAFVQNPLVRSVAVSAGVESKALDQFATDPVSRKWLERLASRDVVVAYVPSIGYSGRPAWVMASWIGGYSQRLRWLFSWGSVPDVRRVNSDGTRSIWLVHGTLFRGTTQLSLALREGILLAAVSDDATAVRYLIEASDRSPLVPSARSSHQLDQVRALWPAEMTTDRGWVNLGGLRARGPELLAYAWALKPGGGMQAVLRAAYELPPAPDVPVAAAGSPGRLAGDLSQAVVLLPWSHVRAFLPPPEASFWVEAVDELVKGAAADRGPGHVLVGVVGGEYSGRIRSLLGGATLGLIKGLKVPGLVAAVPVADAEQARQAMLSALDKLNAKYQLGLIPRPVADFNAGAITAIEGTRGGFYGRFEPDEQIAYTVTNGWLLLASNAGSLKHLLAKAADKDAAGTAPGGAWKDVGAVPGANAYGWVDLTAFSGTLRESIAAVSLALLVKSGPETKVLRQNLAEVRAWVETVQPMKHGALWLTSNGAVTDVRIDLGD